MRLFIFCLFVLFLACGLSPQLRTRYTPLPAIARVKRRVWRYSRPRWGIAIMVVRLA